MDGIELGITARRKNASTYSNIVKALVPIAQRLAAIYRRERHHRVQRALARHQSWHHPREHPDPLPVFSDEAGRSPVLPHHPTLQTLRFDEGPQADRVLRR
jgi:hypothetical protein